MDPSYGLMCRRTNTKRTLFALLHFYDVHPTLRGLFLLRDGVLYTLLRCAERRMYIPRWSNEILDELRRTLLEKLGRSPEQVDHLLNELNRHFADARVEGFETLVALMTNDPGDRHVAAAVKCGAEAIVTFNLRHFPDAALDTWNIEVQHPDEFLVHLYHLNPDLIVNILHEPAAFIGRTLTQLLDSLPS